MNKRKVRTCRGCRAAAGSFHKEYCRLGYALRRKPNAGDDDSFDGPVGHVCEKPVTLRKFAELVVSRAR